VPERRFRPTPEGRSPCEWRPALPPREMRFCALQHRNENANPKNNRNSKYEPTVFSECAGSSAGKRRNLARPCFQLAALVEERLGDLSAKRQTRSMRDTRDQSRKQPKC
jgi:hypothetical protein